jgi:hypothetical protein
MGGPALGHSGSSRKEGRQEPNPTVGRASYGRHGFGRPPAVELDVYVDSSAQVDDVVFSIY